MLDLLSLQTAARDFPRIDFREKRTGLFKILLPFFHEDGDMYDLFVEECPKNHSLLRLSDYGLTLMRLSYNFEIDTTRKSEVLENTILQNRCLFHDGEIYLDIAPEQFSMGIYQFAQVIAKVCAMDMLSYDTAQSLFYENLNRYMTDQLEKYHYQKNYTPTSDRQLIVDYRFPPASPRGRSLFVFGVNENTKASKVVISCLSFKQKKIPFRSVIVHEDFGGLSVFNRNQITNTVDKQFATLDDFCAEGSEYIAGELVS